MLLTGILFFDAIRKWVTEDQNSKNINSIEAEQANIKFAKQFLCCWDFGLVKESDVDDLQCTVGSNMTTLLQVRRPSATATRDREARLAAPRQRTLSTLTNVALHANTQTPLSPLCSHMCRPSG